MLKKEKKLCKKESGLLPVLREKLLDGSLGADIKLHENHISKVGGEQEEGLPPLDLVVKEEEDEREQRYTVEGTVSEERPPGQVEHRLAEQRAHADDKEDVEDGRADNGADADV